MLGDIKILFGTIVDVDDSNMLYRCRVSIPGHTDKIDTDKLPWYFCWYGVNYLPVVNDEVGVLVFDNDFTTAFYGRKVDAKFDGDNGDYASYLEIYKRDGIELTYTKSNGITFVNKDASVKIEIDKLTLFAKTNSIEITEDKINIGNKNQEATILGDKGVELLGAIIDLQQKTITEMLKMFAAVVSGASPSVLTMAISSSLSPTISAAASTLTPEIPKLKAKTKTIQSKKVFIE